MVSVLKSKANYLLSDEDIKRLQNEKDLMVRSKVQDLSNEEIKRLQKIRDIKNQKYIENARREGVIDNDTAKYLSEQYSNSMEKYTKFVLSIIDSLDMNHFVIKPYDLKTGEIKDTKNPYELKDITPNSSVVLISKDSNGNDVNLYLPGMKSIERAVDKVKIGGKYDKQYKNELAEGKINNPLKPYERLSDINRCLITAEFKGQLFDFVENINNSDFVESCDLVNRFTIDIHDKKNRDDLINDPKNRRELKGRYKTKSGRIEIQFNTNILAKYDKLTHDIYEEYRQKSESSQSSDTKYAIMKKDQMINDIKETNTLGLREYNAKVIENAVAMKSYFESKMMIAGIDACLSYGQQIEIAEFLTENLEARRNRVFNPDRHIPEGFEDYKILIDAIKDMYLYNNYEAVYCEILLNAKNKNLEYLQNLLIEMLSLKNNC